MDDFDKLIENFYDDWKKNPPRLLSTFGQREAELAAIKIIDNHKGGYFTEEIFETHLEKAGFCALCYKLVEKRGESYFATPEFFDIIREKHPQELN